MIVHFLMWACLVKAVFLAIISLTLVANVNSATAMEELTCAAMAVENALLVHCYVQSRYNHHCTNNRCAEIIRLVLFAIPALRACMPVHLPLSTFPVNLVHAPQLQPLSK